MCGAQKSNSRNVPGEVDLEMSDEKVKVIVRPDSDDECDRVGVRDITDET